MAENSLLEDGIPRLREIADQLPKNIDFGFCAVGQPTERTFKLVNHGNADKWFSFEECIFQIEPMRDVIPPKSTKTVTISYTPSDATVVVASSIFRIDGENDKVVKVSAIGKFPFLKTQSSKLDFGEVIYGKKKVLNLIINNASEVSTRFDVRKLQFDEYVDTSFSLDTDTGIIPPKSSFLVKVTYKPMIWDLFSCTHFEIQCQGGNRIEVQCLGKALSIEARLNSRLVDFGSIRLNSSTNRMVTLHNHSDANCSFEIVIDNSGVFSVKEITGIIKPKSYSRLLFIFTPQKTINYYQRVYILVRNHLALYIDLMGNCFDLLIKPPPLNPSVVKQARMIAGNTSSILKLTHMEAELENDENESNKQTAVQSLSIHKELFGGLDFSEQFIKCDSKFLDFSYSDTRGNYPTREVAIENLSGRKISLFWTDDAPYTGGKENVFNVSPAVSHLKPKEISHFTITFRPNHQSAFFFERVQCYAIDYDTNVMEKISKASFKMKKQMVGMANLSTTHGKDVLEEQTRNIPPIELGIFCSGNSFSPETQPFIPMIQVFPRNEIIFSPCSTGDTAYGSLQLFNKTDTPSFFKFDEDNSKTFDVFPKCGIIEGHRFKLIFFKFSPTEPSLHQKVFHCRLNNAVDVIRIKLTGYCCQPRLQIDNNSQIFFPPSFLGVHSKQKLGFHNRSRVSLSYLIDVPRKYGEELMFGPVRGVLLPNQSEYITCSFMPLKKKKYQIKVPVEVYGEHSEKAVEDQQLEIYGEGGDGSLIMKPDLVDFGIIKVNFHRMEKVTIYNHSHVTFFLNLEIRPYDDTVKFDEATRRAIANSFNLDFTEGLITGHSKIEVSITFNPIEICELKVKLVCLAKEKPPLGVIGQTATGITEKSSIELRANGRFPILKIVDVRNEDLSVSTLWDSLKLDKVNKELLEKTNGGRNEVKDFEDLANTQEKDEAIERNYHEWNFGYLQNKPSIEPRRIVLTIQNVGGTDLDWRFKFPNDNQINAEPWADPGEQSEKEAYEKMILEKKIFQVHPRSGVLKPNEKQNLQLIYSPNMDEEIYDKKGNKEPTQDHKLRVILHIENGKSLKLLFRGKTLAHLQAQLSFNKTTYNLPALPIGMIVPVIIPIQMENVGSGNINRCEIEEDEIIRANQENGAAKVFDIENRITNFTANEKKSLFIHFKPAEAKEYNFFIRVKTFDFVRELEGKRIHLRGWGYDQNKPPQLSIQDTGIPKFKSSSDELSPEAFFSIEEIDFGEVSAQETVSRIFLLYNNSSLSRLQFNFDKPKFICKDTLSINPVSATLGPGEHMEVKLTLSGSISPSIYEGELECKVIWLDYEKKNRTFVEEKKKATSKNEASRQTSPRSSVDRGRMMERMSQLKSETLFLRMRKRCKISVVDQREALRGQSQKSKEFKEKEDTGESIFNNILARMIKDILSSEQATSIVDNVLNQAPRLYCFFDQQNPVRVDEMEEEQKELGDGETKLNEEGSQLISPRIDDRQEVLNFEQIREPDVSPIQKSARFHIARGKSSQDNTHRSIQDTSRSKLANIPEHINPNDIIDESQEDQSMMREPSLVMPQVPPIEVLDNIMMKDEFKVAAQSVLDDIFMSLVKESVTGGLNLNEKQSRSSNHTKAQSRGNLYRMRSQLSVKDNMSTSNLKA